MGSVGGGEQQNTGTQQSTTTSEPWSGLQPFLKDLYKNASNWYNETPRLDNRRFQASVPGLERDLVTGAAKSALDVYKDTDFGAGIADAGPQPPRAALGPALDFSRFWGPAIQQQQALAPPPQQPGPPPQGAPQGPPQGLPPPRGYGGYTTPIAGGGAGLHAARQAWGNRFFGV